MMEAQISEIFQSVQGEGLYTGVKQVFIRFYACNMQCAWCDTSQSRKSSEYQTLSLEDVLSQVQELWDVCHSISLTGGEPLLQRRFIKECLPFFKKNNKLIYLETNGILSEDLEDINDFIDIISMDIKLPSSTKGQAYWQEHQNFLKKTLEAKHQDVFIKVVVSFDTQKEDIEKSVQLVSKVNPQLPFIIQPNSLDFDKGVVSKCIEYQNYCLKYLSNVRIIPQLHKFLKVR